MDDRTRQLVVLGIIGLIAGYLASIVLGGSGLIRYLVTGVIGAFVGGYVLQALGVGIQNKFASQIVTATIGAIAVVILARIIA